MVLHPTMVATEQYVRAHADKIIAHLFKSIALQGSAVFLHTKAKPTTAHLPLGKIQETGLPNKCIKPI